MMSVDIAIEVALLEELIGEPTNKSQAAIVNAYWYGQCGCNKHFCAFIVYYNADGWNLSYGCPIERKKEGLTFDQLMRLVEREYPNFVKIS